MSHPKDMGSTGNSEGHCVAPPPGQAQGKYCTYAVLPEDTVLPAGLELPQKLVKGSWCCWATAMVPSLCQVEEGSRHYEGPDLGSGQPA